MLAANRSFDAFFRAVQSTGGSEAIVNVRPQKPGRYEFYDDFHEETTRGALIVK